MAKLSCYTHRGVVVDTRVANGTIRRRRECEDCGDRWTTYEITQREYRKFMEHEKQESMLDEPVWCVIGFDQIKGFNLIYSDAEKLLEQLEASPSSDKGLTIVTLPDLSAVAHRRRGRCDRRTILERRPEQRL